MSDAWFHHEGLAGTDRDATIELKDDEAMHAVRSLRVHPGDPLTLFDGRGTIARCEVIAIGPRRRSLSLRIVEREAIAPPRLRVHLCCALPKGDRQSTLLSMCTQCGMTDFTPLICQRSVAHPGPNSAERWQRLVLESCKQSHRAWLPVVHDACSLNDVVDEASSRSSVKTILAHPEGEPLIAYMRNHDTTCEEIRMLIGPEGGFAPDELDLALQRGVPRASLGPYILRIETAAVVATALAAANA